MARMPAASTIMRNVTMEVRVPGLRVAKMRVRVGVWIIRLAVRVAGIGVKFIDERES